MDPGSTFFTTISHTTIAQRKMEIPRAIATRMQALSTNIILRDRYKNLWPVEVAKDKDRGGLYFEKGWMKLCEDYSLEMGDTFVFKYRDNNVFEFKLLGINACEKECVGGLKITVKEEEVEEEEAEDEEEEDDTELEDSYNEDENYVVKEEEHEDEDDEQDNISRKVNLKSKSKSKTNHASSSVLNRGLTIGPGTSPKKRVHEKRTAPDWYGADLFKSGLVPQPKNPYFVSISRHQCRKNALYIPKEVITDYKLNIQDEVYLVDENGRKWCTDFKKWGDGRLWCSRGWKSLCNVNFIENDDTCICEFVQGEGNNELNILVRVVKGLEK